MSKISGIGNSQTRKNEITADDIATLRRYTFGWDYGVINRSGWNFNATTNYDTDMITVDKGIMFAYGYFGILTESITIPFIKPSATQYRIIYGEIDRSVVPNTFKIKVKNNQGSNKIKPTTFRQDYLTAIKTGVFQLPLWQVELNNQGIVKVVDVRELKDYIKKAHHTNYTTVKVTKSISENAIATTQLITDRSKKLATTEFVHLATRKYIDGYAFEVNVDISITNGVVSESKLVFNDKNWNIEQLITIQANFNYDISTINYDNTKIALSLKSSATREGTYGVKLLERPNENTTYFISVKCVH